MTTYGPSPSTYGITYVLSGSSASVSAFDNTFANPVVFKNINYLGNNYIVNGINGNSFSGSSIVSITIPNTISNIRNFAFNGCNLLSTLLFENGNPGIQLGNNSFYNCGNLTSVIVPGNSSLGNAAFAGCSKLATLKILSGGSRFGVQSLMGTPNNIVVTFGPGNVVSMDHIFGGFPPSPETKQGTAIAIQPINGLSYIYANFTNVSVECFLEGTKILTNNGYIPIQDLKKGDNVKTSLNGYKKIEIIGKKDIYHLASEERIKDQLYLYSKLDVTEVFEDLVLTGCHSVLVDNFESEEQKKKLKNYWVLIM